MIRRPPRSTRTDTLLPYTTLFRSLGGPAKSLVPPHGRSRRDCLQLMAIATGVLDKAVAAIYEVRRRPAEKVHEPWGQHLLIQATGGLKALEAHKQRSEEHRLNSSH